MPPDPLESKKIPLPLRGSENFFGSGTAPPPPKAQNLPTALYLRAINVFRVSLINSHFMHALT